MGATRERVEYEPLAEVGEDVARKALDDAEVFMRMAELLVEKAMKGKA